MKPERKKALADLRAERDQFRKWFGEASNREQAMQGMLHEIILAVIPHLDIHHVGYRYATDQALARLCAPQPAAVGVSEADTIAYLRSLKPGERVMETGRSGIRGWTGTVYEMDEGRGSGVRWDVENGGEPPGVMCTSVTHGTRRIRDVLAALQVVAGGEANS